MNITPFGASRNNESKTDEEYVRQLMEKSKPKVRHYDDLVGLLYGNLWDT